MTVARLRRTMSAREFTEWQAYYKIAPWGDDWLQTGMLIATQVNLWSKRKYKPHQFIPHQRERLDPHELESRLMRFAAQHNARN